MSYNRVLTVTLSRCRHPLLWIAAFSLLINILMLTSSLYMMQVYDRVIGSGSLATLVFLTIVAAGSLALMSALDFIRSRALSGLGEWLERRLGANTLERSIDNVLAGRGERADALRDLEALRGFFSGGVTFLFDTPWVPVYIGAIYLLHPILGHIAVAAAVVLFLLALANNSPEAQAPGGGQCRQPPRHAHRRCRTPQCRGRGGDGLDA